MLIERIIAENAAVSRAVYLFIYLFIICLENDNHNSSKNIPVHKLENNAKKLALTIADNKPSHTQHVKISLYILSLQIVVLCQNQYN